MEPLDEGNANSKQKAEALAERLALALWASVPDEKLLARVENDQLNTPVQVGAEIDRLISQRKERTGNA